MPDDKNNDKGGKVKIQDYLEGIRYPATKQSVMDIANDSDAPAEIMDVLANITDKDYSSTEDVAKEIATFG